jgi:hypothetical protein
VGEMKRATAREVEERQQYEAKVRDRFASTLVIGACIIAAVRLARDENIGRSTPPSFLDNSFISTLLIF